MSEFEGPCWMAQGRYILVWHLGSGSLGDVYRAWDTHANEWRAIKVLSAWYSKKRVARGRFLAMAENWRALNHPHAVQVLDVGEQYERPYLVCEYLNSGTPADWVKISGPMAEQMALDVTIQVCRAVRAAHEQGLLHLDIKPENIHIASDGLCKVTDFGLGRVRETGVDLAKDSEMGVMDFMAPERRINMDAADERADVYSIAAILYNLLTDRRWRFRDTETVQPVAGMIREEFADVLNGALVKFHVRTSTVAELEAQLTRLYEISYMPDEGSAPLARPPLPAPPVPDIRTLPEFLAPDDFEEEDLSVVAPEIHTKRRITRRKSRIAKKPSFLKVYGRYILAVFLVTILVLVVAVPAKQGGTSVSVVAEASVSSWEAYDKYFEQQAMRLVGELIALGGNKDLLKLQGAKYFAARGVEHRYVAGNELLKLCEKEVTSVSRNVPKNARFNPDDIRQSIANIRTKRAVYEKTVREWEAEAATFNGRVATAVGAAPWPPVISR